MKKSKLENELEEFLTQMGKNMFECTPEDICMFLAFKDKTGKTPVHHKDCVAIGEKSTTCPCPRRLAFGTVTNKISQLKSIFEQKGMEGPWKNLVGNPVDSSMVKVYVKQSQIEQSIGHVISKQAKPLFLSKLIAISMYIDRHMQSSDSNNIRKFILARDQAIFKLMFFGGDRAHDVGLMLTQEIRELPNKTGYVIRHTMGKTHRVNKPNVFSLFRNPDDIICPVKGVEQYFDTARHLDINLDTGFLFRPVKSRSVINRPLDYQAIYCRLKLYLRMLDIDQGETPHSIRGACAISLRSMIPNILPPLNTQHHMMNHVGWRTNASASHYSREGKLSQATIASKALSAPSSDPIWADIEADYFDETELPKFHMP